MSSSLPDGASSAQAPAPAPSAEMPPALLEVQDLHKSFAIRRGVTARVLRGVDLTIRPEQIVGLVGESGCGKSTLARCILRLQDVDAGHILFDGTEITSLSPRALRPFRRHMQLIFQDPFSSLNPRLTVEAIITEPLLALPAPVSRRARRQRAEELLAQVGLPATVLQRFPHEFSAGQRQRVGIARALAARPRFIIADEPISSLDMSTQVQVLDLLATLQERERLSYLFIAHNLRLVLSLSHQVAVMYLGRLVELGPAAPLAQSPLHPYTQALLAAIPFPDPGHPPARALPGSISSTLELPRGCAFHPRCAVYAKRKSARCTQEEPELRSVAAGEHRVACHEVE